MIQLAQVEGHSLSVCGDAHAGQSSVDDLVMTCRSRTQCSHMKGLPGVETLRIGQGHTIDARMYR